MRCASASPGPRTPANQRRNWRGGGDVATSASRFTGRPRAAACADARAPSECAPMPCQGPSRALTANRARTHCGSVLRAPSLRPCAGRSIEHRIESRGGEAVAERAPLLRIARPAVDQQDARPAGRRIRALPGRQLAAFEGMARRRPRRRHRPGTRLLLSRKRGEEQLQREPGRERRRPSMRRAAAPRPTRRAAGVA